MIRVIDNTMYIILLYYIQNIIFHFIIIVILVVAKEIHRLALQEQASMIFTKGERTCSRKYYSELKIIIDKKEENKVINRETLRIKVE